jgi:DNA mismatch repair ATPase MutS
MTRERDVNGADQGATRETLSAVESVFKPANPAKLVLFDPSGKGRDSIRSMWSLSNQYASLFGRQQALGAFKPQYITWDEMMSRDDGRWDEMETERAAFAGENESWRMGFFRKEEAEKMVEFFFAPPIDPEQRTARQKFLEQLSTSENLDELVTLKNRAYRVLEGLGDLNASHGSEFQDDRSLLQHYLDGETETPVYDDDYDPDPVDKKPLMPQIVEAVDTITDGLSALQSLATHPDPALKVVFSDLPEFVEAVAHDLPILAPMDKAETGVKRDYPFFPSNEEAWEWRRKKGYPEWFSNELHDTQRGLEPYLYRMGVLLEFAKIIQDQGWGKVTFDPNQPFSYEQGWNIEAPKESQVKNDGTVDAPVVILSGANTSGKSFLMKSDFLTRVGAQSLGFAPVAAGNFRPYERFIFLDRAGTDSANDLSAFMKEVQNWNLALEDVNDSTRLYVDEGFSTTSPQDQARLLGATANFIQNRGGAVMLATHNEHIISQAANNPNAALYHLAVEVGVDGELVRHFRLQEGKSESHSFAVARARNFPQNTLDIAEAYQRGDASHFEPLRSPKFPTIEAFTQEERERQKAEVRSLDHLFPTLPANSTFHLMSTDGDFQLSRFLAFTTQQRKEDIMGAYEVDRQKEFLARMILMSPELRPAEALERQRMIDELRMDSMHIQLHAAIGKASELDRTITALKEQDKTGVNRELNPFKERENRWRSPDAEEQNPPFSEDGLKRAIAFLKIQQKLLGSNFEFSYLLDQFLTFSEMYERATKQEDGKWGKKDDPLNEPALLLLHLVQDKEEKEAQGDKPLTREMLEEMIERRFGTLRKVSKELPVIPLDQINVGAIKAELAVLGEHGGIAKSLDSLPDQLADARALVDLLRSTDSVYLNQAANFVEQHVNSELEVLMGEKTDAESGEPEEDQNQRRSYSVYGTKREQTPYERTLEQVDSLCLLTDIIETEGFTPVVFNDTGEVTLTNGFSLFKRKKDEVKNSVSLNSDRERIQLLTGPNGSGKTFYEKGAVASILTGLATGYAPAEVATMPVFDAVIYLDRVTQKQDASLSAFSQELEYWKRLLPLLSTKQTVFAAVDEAFSTTSPTYQAAFTDAVVTEFLNSPHFLMLATHNHDVVNYLEDSQIPLVKPYHFQFSTEDGKVLYQYKLQEGHETSHALGVARTMGFPEEIIDATQH